jgi:hypoxanthine phosphoribosyltransferase
LNDSVKGEAGKIPPKYWRGDVERVLIEREQIQVRVSEIAEQIQHAYEGSELVIVALLNGTVMFLADLVRHLELPLRLDFIGVSSYGSGTTAGELAFTKELKLDVKGRHVLLVDDILDTGRTLRRVTEKLNTLKPKTLKSCVLLDKKSRRVEKFEADFVGFEIPDLFVVGYGMDFAERYRNLPFVGVLKDQVYTQK